MRVTVDAVLCEANALCARIAPEVFSTDDDDVLNIAADGEVSPDQAAQVREAVRCCPKMALLLQE
jgi:ferredoxin